MILSRLRLFHKRLLVVLCVLLNSGCFGPTYTRPLVAVPQQWPNQHELKKHEPANLADMLWWKQFKSPELNEFIKRSLQHNGQVQTSIAKIDQTRSQLEQVKLNWIPNVTALAGYSQFPILGDPGGIAMAYPAYIVNIFQLYKQQKKAKAIYEASIYAMDCVRLVVIAQTAASFFVLIAQQESMKLYNQLLADYRHYLKIVSSRYRSGLTSQDAIERVQSKIKEIQSQIEVTRYNMVVSKNTLRFLFNENPGDLTVTTSFRHLNTDAIIPGNVPASVLSARPDIHRDEALLRAAHANVGAVTASLLPNINLGAYLGTSSDGAIKLSQAYMTMPMVDLSIFAQINTSKAQYKGMYIKYIVAIKEALRDVANDLSAFTAYTYQLNNNSSALNAVKKRCHLIDVRFRNGLEDNLELVKCHIRQDEFELMINQNKLQKMIAIVALYQDLAGGYHGS